MSSEEEKRILDMVEQGVITPEEAMALIKALGTKPVESEVEVIDLNSEYGSVIGAGPEFEEVKARAQRFAQIPLWIGICTTVLASYWLFTLVQNSNYGFWFACAWFPLMLGILLLALSSGGMNSRWVYVDVQQGQEQWPQHITLGLPLPLGLVGWFLRNFRHQLHGARNVDIDEMLDLLTKATREEPLVVNVQDDEDGDSVQVYIG